METLSLKPLTLSKILALILSGLVIVGCGKDETTAPLAPPPNNFNPFTPVPLGQRYRGTVQISNRDQYQRFLRENNFCFNFIINTCAWTDRNPVMGLQFQGIEVDLRNGIGAQVIIEVLQDSGWYSGAVPYPTRFYYINNNQALEAVTYGFAGTASYNAEIVITITGKPGDNRLNGALSYRGSTFGRVDLVRF